MADMTELEQAERNLIAAQAIVDYLRARQTPAPAPRQRRERSNGRVTAATVAERLLREHGQMPTRDLLRAVQQAGARMKDSDGLTKTLTRHPQFVRVSRGVWKVAD